jgi:hypothetical protein
MSIEEKKSDVSLDNKEQPATEPQLSKEQKSPDKISVDLAPGVSVELDTETARKVIEHRNAKSSGYKALESRLKEVEGAKKVAEDRAKLIELAKAQDYDALKLEASKEYAQKLEKIQGKIVAKELESALLTQDDFLKESKEDAIKLLKTEFTFQVNEEGDKVVTQDGKEVNEVVKEWLSKKEIFRRAKGATSTGAKTQGGKLTHKAQVNPMEGVSKGLGKLLGGN